MDKAIMGVGKCVYTPVEKRGILSRVIPVKTGIQSFPYFMSFYPSFLCGSAGFPLNDCGNDVLPLSLPFPLKPLLRKCFESPSS